MEVREELQNQFSELCVSPSDDVLDKCCEICILNNMDPEEFVETWMAYSLSHLNGAEPTVETILRMEKKELSQRKAKIDSPKQEEVELNIYTTPKSNNILRPDNALSTTPKSVKNTTINRSIGFSQSPRTAFSPSTYSPDVGLPCTNYETRTNSGLSVVSHGEKRVTSQPPSWQPSLKVWTPADGEQIPSFDHRLMMERLSVKGDIWSDRIEEFGKLICDENKLDEPAYYDQHSTDKFATYGRIKSAEGRLHMKSVMLESSEPLSRGRTLRLLVHEMMLSGKPAAAAGKNVCTGLFPGQVVAVEGVCAAAGKMAVHCVYSPAPPELAPAPTLAGTLKIVIAAAPFTQADNLLYQPLEDFVKYLKTNQPHVAIIIGPIVDATHSKLAAASIAETFAEMQDRMLKGIVGQLAGCKTQLVYVVSAKDAAQMPVYPTIPVTDKIPGLTMVSDPSILSISGLMVAISATDVLMHLSKEEVALSGQSGDRLGRLASHLLTQHNFYPLYPPNQVMAIDTSLWESQAGLPITPHLLVLPSDLRYFIKNVGSSVVVNPERLAKGQAGGTFAILEIYPGDASVWSPATHIHGQILKV